EAAALVARTRFRRRRSEREPGFCTSSHSSKLRLAIVDTDVRALRIERGAGIRICGDAVHALVAHRWQHRQAVVRDARLDLARADDAFAVRVAHGTRALLWGLLEAASERAGCDEGHEPPAPFESHRGHCPVASD